MDSGPQIENEFDALLADMANQNYEDIRFPSYRVACKLQFIQRKTSFYLVDIWNTIESLRENGLQNHNDLKADLTTSKLEALVTTIFYQLSKRLPPSHTINLEESISCFTTFLSTAYDPNCTGRLRVLSIKLALVALSSGKIVDKLRYFYSLISDANNGQMMLNRFCIFLQELLALPGAVYEADSYQYDPTLPESIFDFSDPVDIMDFVDVFVGSNGSPACLSWFTAFHKLTDTETVVHHTRCDSCHKEPFAGLRYKCQKCFSYTLCQDCFWRGKTSGSHNVDTHSCKEYCYWQSPRKQFGESIRRSFRCKPAQNPKIYIREELSRDKRLNMAQNIPPSPLSVHQSMPAVRNSSSNSKIMTTPIIHGRSPSTSNSNNSVSSSSAGEDEHALIALYAKKLALYEKGGLGTSDAKHQSRTLSNGSLHRKQQMVAQLELRNRELIKEIARIRQEGSDIRRDERALMPADAGYLAELSSLKLRKEELERHLSALQLSRKELLLQLESLMGLLKNHDNLMSTVGEGGKAMRNAPTHNATKATKSPVTLVNITGSPASRDSNDTNPKKKHNALLSANTTNSATNAVASSVVKGLHKEEEATIDEIALNLSKQLRLKEKEEQVEAVIYDEPTEFVEPAVDSHHVPSKQAAERLHANLAAKALFMSS
ncbi:Dystrobrevin alpha [Halotydeus destructor]|nr:Dystrobrevin alpha [Halotydeus destructor]